MFNKIFKIYLPLILIPIHIAFSQPESPYNLISSGGQKSANSSFIVNSSIGETFTGKSINSINQMLAGFWSIYQSDNIVYVKDGYNLPKEFNLEQNYPNPFNPSTTIQFSLPKQTQIKIILYNILGEKLITLTDGTYEAGYHKVTFNSGNLSSGTYIYRFESDEFIQVKKMILLK